MIKDDTKESAEKWTKEGTRARLESKMTGEHKGKEGGGRGQGPRNDEGRKDPPHQGGEQVIRGETV